MSERRWTENIRRWTAVLLTLAICWIAQAGCTQPMPKPLYEIPGGDPDRGRQAMTEYGCTACHTIPGVTNGNATVGPSLAGWAKRGSIAGHYPNTPENLVAWIQDPQQMSPGSLMPDVGVP